MIRLIMTLICALFIALPRLEAGGTGTTRMNFLRIMPGARAAGMAGAYGAAADDVYAAAWNPAGLAGLERREASFTRVAWLEGVTYHWLSAAFPLSRGRAAGAGDRFPVDDFDDGDPRNALGGAMGTWDDRAGGGTSTAEAAFPLLDASGGAGRSYEICYHVVEGPDGREGGAGAWFALEGADAASRGALSFRVRGAAGGERFSVGLKDARGTEIKRGIDRYVKVTADGWETAVIPLAEFTGVDLGNLHSISLTFSGSGRIFVDDIAFTGGIAAPHVIAVTLAHLNSGAMTHYEEIEAPPYYERKESFEATESVLMLSYATEQTVSGFRMPVGVSVKLLREKLFTYSNPSWGVALDAGALYRFDIGRGAVALGLAVQNAGYAAPAERDTNPLPFNVKTSFALRPARFPALIGFDVDSPVDGRSRLSLGAECRTGNTALFRAGYAFGQDLGGLSAGAGFAFRDLRIDYAFVPYAALGNAHRVSLTYRWSGAHQ